MGLKKWTAQAVMCAKDGKHNIEPNLYLKVNEKKKERRWVFIYSLNGKSVEFGIGGAGKVSLQQAKLVAKELRAKLALGIDPREERREKKAKAKAQAELQKRNAPILFKDFYEPTVKAIGEVKRWKSPRNFSQWLQTLSYALPYMGEKAVESITKDDVVKALKPIWESKPGTAKKLREFLDALFSYAIRQGIYKGLNPAAWKDNLAFELPSQSKFRVVKHFKAMPHSELKEQIGAFYPPQFIGDALVVFTILSASRICETCPAKWEEFDFEKKVWNCPPERRKDGKKEPHRVPLSDVMVRLLQWLPRVNEFVFFSDRSASRHLERGTARVMLQHRLDTDATMHGMRSTFRDWCAEVGIPDILAEKSLMHATGNEVVQAYQRSDLLEQRRAVIERWSEYLLGDPD